MGGAAERQTWAVLVAGSRGFFNYRHQADVCHAYQMLRERGVPEERIVTMMYDDVANNKLNPFPGKLFNEPTAADQEGVDVYAGCNLDYTGKHVTPEVFMDVLEGNHIKLRGKGSGRFLNSTARDDVFINFVDHGAVGLVAFPTAELHASDLIESLKKTHAKKKFRNLVFYMEACESGSMFAALPPEMNIFALTAANAHESSFATYCPPTADKVQGTSMRTCLADEFSSAWMEDTDAQNPSQRETLQDQYGRVKARTKKSHVLEFGDIATMSADSIDEFLGDPVKRVGTEQELLPQQRRTDMPDSAIDSRDVALVSKFYMYLDKPTPDMARLLQEEIEHRTYVDALIRRIGHFALDGDAAKVEEVIPSQGGPQTPDEVTCHRTATQAFRNMCGAFTDYSLKYVATLLNLCRATMGQGTYRVIQAIQHHCDEKSRQ
ncbi:Vacuolar-processing enzyme (VPE) (Proteinase B) [Durusdinium trenchii]|uniref:Vacuolar-processing enzyme (VPE) (Proteinase B) n=1 Tax=Durusdinium trenchii TaxID=1381693 RepID=A0ABP0J8T4_9DINO